MDIQIRTGEGLECEYSGHDSIALVRIKRDDVDVEGEWTHWMGRSALEQAMRMLSVAEGVPPPVAALTPAQAQVLSNLTPIGASPPPAPPPQGEAKPAGWVKKSNPPVLMQQFERQLNRLIERGENEEDEKGKLRGLIESEVRDLIATYIESCPNRTQIFGVLRRKTAMDRDRFDMLVSSIEAEALTERYRAAAVDDERALGERP